MLGEIQKIFIIWDGRASQAKYLHNTEKGKKKKYHYAKILKDIISKIKWYDGENI